MGKLIYFHQPDEISIPPPVQEEDFWQNPVAPASYPAPRAFLDDEAIGIAPPIREELYWTNPVRPVAASHYLRLPYLPDVEVIPVFFAVTITIGSGQTFPVKGSGKLSGVRGVGEVSSIIGDGEVNKVT